MVVFVCLSFWYVVPFWWYVSRTHSGGRQRTPDWVRNPRERVFEIRATADDSHTFCWRLRRRICFSDLLQVRGSVSNLNFSWELQNPVGFPSTQQKHPERLQRTTQLAARHRPKTPGNMFERNNPSFVNRAGKSRVDGSSDFACAGFATPFRFFVPRCAAIWSCLAIIGDLEEG